MNDNKIFGYTDDGLSIDTNMGYTDTGLRFCLLTMTWYYWDYLIGFKISHNLTPDLKKRPYVSIWLFGLNIQSGWLF